MDLVGAFFLLFLGFVVGISGAVMPGPLLIYTIHESLKKGKWAGATVVTGHVFVEVIVFFLLAYGVLEYASTPAVVKAVSLIGGAALILMALFTLKNIDAVPRPDASVKKHGLIAGGFILSALNPGFTLWWATAGTRMLLEGLNRMGFIGMILVVVGHWGADYGWFLFVSMTASKSSGLLLEKGWYKKVRMILAGFLVVIGIYFVWTGI